MTSTRLALSLVLAFSLSGFGCGDDSSTTTDSGTSRDSGSDSGTVTDSGTDSGALDCDGYGTACGGAGDCAAGLDCVNSYCLPAGTPICGGFAGTMCTGGKMCMPITGTDFGACIDTNQLTCVCSSPTAQSRFLCGTGA